MQAYMNLHYLMTENVGGSQGLPTCLLGWFGLPGPLVCAAKGGCHHEPSSAAMHFPPMHMCQLNQPPLPTAIETER